MVIVWLEEVRSKDVALVGGKGASLGEMMNEELPVPRGFAVTAHAFRQFLDETGIAKRLFESLEIDVDDSEALKNAAKRAKSLILNAEMPSEMKAAILEAYDKLCEREGEAVFVAVRSSATAEDLPNASFAGQQETFLNIHGGKAVLEAVKRCWGSLYGARAIFYRAKQGFEHEHVNIAVIIQTMVDADKAGVLFTSHPTSGEPTTIIEADWGLGEAVVSGAVSPDNYVVDRRTKKIVQRHIATKNLMHVKDKDTGKTVQKKVPDDMKDKPVLTDGEVMKLTELGEIVENHYGAPQDVEWAIADGKIYMLQSRPITTIQKKAERGESGGTGELILEGIGASPGLAYGNVEIISKLDELDKVGEGDILVTQMTTPDMVTAMKRAVGVITDEGGLTCHAAIVSRELGTPCIVGTKKGTKVLKDVKVVTIDGEKGHVYKGKVEQAIVKEEGVAAPVARARQVTVTEVKVNISIPEAAERAAATGADGVGLLRIEHMILGLGKHPALYIKEGKSEEYVDELVKGIRIVADAFYPRSVWVRTLDAPTDEFKSMQGGEDEPVEHNPMMGWRGIRRDLSDVGHFKLELQAFKKLYALGYDNIGIMLPMVQHPKELRKAKQIMVESGLELDKIELGIMVETPASALVIDQFIEEGLDFISFGTNDLTQYTLAVDRNNENVADLYEETHPAVIKLIEDVIKECNRAGVKTSICGQAGSSPSMAKKLVELGITSISANVDAVESVREAVLRSEKAILLNVARRS
ncbi:MAG: phosphoenolpyruvate synthase [Methanocellales archaeon]|nr:phosphoenolpyruvate synthase [Methanocellales archaeon]MDD3292076.1 phosphoenolpyruvate synthase [Methanocellales archaeon]MDD5235543.1 phosphoenolpyruvate synthase [Methanocellales archaeon]MDD5485567.1 phosphoenolpyruvate synthase [Methanocellales archaeon]